MTITFYILAAVTILGMAAAMSLRNIVHCVLALTVGFVGLAMLFLHLGAQFIGFTQILVYVGAVSVLAVFVIMMTRSAELFEQRVTSRGWFGGLLVAISVFAVLAWAIVGARHDAPENEASTATAREVGTTLMHGYALPLEIVGLLLTAAFVGAVIVAMPLKRGER